MGLWRLLVLVWMVGVEQPMQLTYGEYYQSEAACEADVPQAIANLVYKLPFPIEVIEDLDADCVLDTERV